MLVVFDDGELRPGQTRLHRCYCNPGLGGSASVTPTSDQSGVFKLGLFTSSAIVLSDPTSTLFTLTFTAQPGVQGVTVPLTWSTIQGDCDVTPPSPDEFIPAVTVANMATYFIGGSIDIPVVQVITGPPIVCNGSTGIV